MYECPKCHAQIPSDVADGRVGRDHKKPDKKSKCGYQFDVQAGKKKQNTPGAGTYRCFAHGTCKSKANHRYAVVAEEIHEKKKQNRIQYKCRACGDRFNVNSKTVWWKTSNPDGCDQAEAT
jgi:rubredoxin